MVTRKLKSFNCFTSGKNREKVLIWDCDRSPLQPLWGKIKRVTSVTFNPDDKSPLEDHAAVSSYKLIVTTWPLRLCPAVFIKGKPTSCPFIKLLATSRPVLFPLALNIVSIMFFRDIWQSHDQLTQFYRNCFTASWGGKPSEKSINLINPPSLKAYPHNSSFFTPPLAVSPGNAER